ncbi:sigma-70 family RNA polymerase sigma factor [Hydrogenothermus marinus]|uniref:RNA polymerase sigma-28 (SigD/FliA/WhiG) subunit n=1 Tax=Hydrogenothermus marinus TaxID=133270 RepID=A0A3M0BJ69_9AQUI|nr:sigma-70 family RNA polymerase sigma factor [Hydrogenothermus marinus]RMA97493.1 RNA polymerase sigma-28 (SigD/FliA/WhiG) subunit [Hydrogenothermus marinus]
MQLTKEEKDKIILDNLNLVKKVASKIYYRIPKGEIDFDELVNIGVIGLMKALDNYDEDKAKFSTYAYIRIRGEILDYLRSIDIVPRGIRDKIKKEEKPIDEIMDMPLSNSAIFLSIEKAIGNSENLKFVDTLKSDMESPEEYAQKVELREKIEATLNLLTENEKRVIQMIFFEEKDLKEISEKLGISIGRISQLKSQAIKKLKNIFKY